MTRRLAPSTAVALLVGASGALAQTGGVVSTVHNLSASGPGTIKAVSETEVCKFCHIPHNANPAEPLWGRPGTYSIPRLGPARLPAPQPDGSSRLCLTCHDGTIALQEVAKVGMVGRRQDRGQGGGLGPDLSGSHPVSITVPENDPAGREGGRDMGLRPLALIRADPDVRLDGRNKMQCTSCHDPHADRYYQAGRVPRFWVKPTVTEVCLVCHELH